MLNNITPTNLSRMVTRIVSSILIAACIQSGVAQNIEDFEHYTVNDGLPSNLIYQIAQDNAGYLWVATDNGVCRFDGIEFQCKNYSDGLPHSDILAIFIDSSNRIWLSTMSPFPCYIHNEQVYCLDDPIVKFPNPSTYTYFQESDSIITVFNSNKSVNISLKTITVLQIDSTISNFDYKAMGAKITPEFKGLMDGKVIIRTHDAGKFQLISPDSQTEDYLPNVSSFVSDWEINHKRRFFENDSLMILRTTKGLHFINVKSQRVSSQVILPTKNVYRHFFDNLKNLWICTKNDGIYKINPAQLSQILGDHQNIQDKPSISGLISFGDKIVSHRGNELLIYDKNLSLKNVIPVGSKDKIIEVVKLEKTLYILTYPMLYTIQYDGKANEHAYYELNPNPGGGALKTFLPTADGSVYIFSTRIIEFKDKKFTFNAPLPNSSRATCATPLNDSIILIGTASGCYEFNRNSHKLSTYLQKIGQQEIAFILTAHQNLYVGTRAGELFHFRIRKSALIEIDKHQLVNTKINGGLLHGDKLVVASNKGIFRFKSNSLTLDVHINQFNNFTGLDIQHLALTDSAYIIADEGQIAGVAYAISSRNNSPKVHFEHISINNKEVIREFPKEMEYSERFFNLHYSAPYFGQSSVEFEHQLVPHDPLPIRSSEVRVNYANLKSGNYIFKVRSILNETNKSAYSIYKFRIKVPWWQTRWFYLACFILFGSVVYYFYQQNKNRRQAQYKLLQQRLNTLHAQMSPHFLFNALQSLQYYINTNNSQKANTYLTSFANVVRKTLDSSANDYITLANEISYLSSYLALEKEKLDDNLEYSISLADQKLSGKQIPSMVLQPFVENAILHGFASRKENNKLQIIFEQVDEHKLKCTICDNGKGVHQKQNNQVGHKSFSTKAIEDKLHLLNQLHGPKHGRGNINIQIQDNNTNGSNIFLLGTTIIVELPFRRSD